MPLGLSGHSQAPHPLCDGGARRPTFSQSGDNAIRPAFSTPSGRADRLPPSARRWAPRGWFSHPLCRLRRRAMHLAPCLKELRDGWFPHTTTTGLDRLIQLLESGSPLLIHGALTRALPMGCLATPIAWHHPVTADL